MRMQTKTSRSEGSEKPWLRKKYQVLDPRGESISSDDEIGLESIGIEDIELRLHGEKGSPKRIPKSPKFMSGDWARRKIIVGS